MTVNEAIKQRRSIRKYVPGSEVSQEQVKSLLEAAMLAPSARNKRPWEFLVVRDREKLNGIMEIHEYTKMLETASLAIVVIGLDDWEVKFFPQDCGAATQNILLQAVSMGLGTCWCAVYPNEKRVDLFKKLLGIEKGIPYNVIAVGVPDEQPESRGFYDEKKIRYI